MNEEDIIKLFKHKFTSLPDGVFGIGDDAAIIPDGQGQKYVISQDHMAEDVHFRLAYFDPENLAHKSLHTNLSDIAAMGATPLYVLLGLALPRTLDMTWAERFSEAFSKSCLQHKIFLIGGDTTRSNHGLFISVTIIGRTPEKNLKFRHGARPGDIICVAGSLGETYVGLYTLEKNIPGFQDLKDKSLRPLALEAEGQWLGNETCVTAMMDVSDGLYTDLTRMMKCSKSGACLDLEALKPSPMLLDASKILNLDVMQCMLAGGEDYALLLTISESEINEVSTKFEQRFGYPLQKIGTVTDGLNVKLLQNGVESPFEYDSYSHFDDA